MGSGRGLYSIDVDGVCCGGALHLPLALAVLIGALGVVNTVALERKIWRRNKPALAPFIDPVSHELPGGRLPLSHRTRHAIPLPAVITTAATIYLAAT